MILKNAIIHTQDGEKKVDLLIKDGLIVRIYHEIKNTQEEIFDVQNRHLLPGIVDLNVRVRDDKLNPKNLTSLSQKAIRSGVTTFVLNSYDGLESGTTIDLLQDMLQSLVPDIYLTISGTNSSGKLNDISILINNGAKVIKDHSDIESNFIRRLMEYAVLKQTPMFWFCEDDSINANAAMNEGKLSSKMGLPGNVKIGEISEAAKITQFAKFYGAKVLLQTLSTHEAVEHISNEGLCNLFTEVAIHNLVLDQSACENFNTYAKLRPPLRCLDQKKSLQKLVSQNRVHMLTSSHSPKSILFKDVAFEEALFGVDSIELYLSLCYTFLVKGGVVDMWQLQKLIASNPSKFMKLEDRGEIKEGAVADFVVFDTQNTFRVENKHSLYNGMQLVGKVAQTFKNGALVYDAQTQCLNDF